jgi:hypothetical protein
MDHSPAFPNGEEQAGAEQRGSEQCACERHSLRAPCEETLIGLARYNRGNSTVLPRRGVRVDAGPGRLCAAVGVSHLRRLRRRANAVIVSGLCRGRGEYGQGQAERQTPEKPNPSSMISHGSSTSPRLCDAHTTRGTGRRFHQADISRVFQMSSQPAGEHGGGGLELEQAEAFPPRSPNGQPRGRR